MSNTVISTAQNMILTFNIKPHFHELRNAVYICRLNPNYDSECEKYTRINILRSNSLGITRKKVSSFYIQNRCNMILRRFKRETCKWFPIVWTSPTFTMSNTIISTARNMILIFTRKTHFYEERHTVYLCRLQPNYDSECESIQE
jgi:uncharacterized cysteine cluster protein YcgN (CxxCxxCC family)